MIRPLFLLGFGLLCSLVAQAQFVTFRFTDGSVVVHPVTDIRSTDFDAGNLRVFLWDGTTYAWSISSLATYQFSDISTAAPAGADVLVPLNVYPNPSSGEVRIGFTSTSPGEARVEVLDAQGRVVRTVHQGPIPERSPELVWDGRDAQGSQVPGGGYLIRVLQGPRVALRQVIIQP
jgi:hypothetical protein